MNTKLFSAPALSNNPFAGATVASKNPFAVEEEKSGGPTGYALVSSGPAVDPSEIENAAQSSFEVSIGWGTSMLHVEHLTPPRAYLVGEREDCSFALPSDKIGSSAVHLVEVDGGQAFAVVLPGARGWLQLAGRERQSLDEVRATAAPSASMAGAVRVALPAGARLRQEVGDLVFSVGSVAAGKKVRRVLFGAASVTGLMFAGLSLLGHASLLGGLAFFKPALSGVDDDADRREREVIMMQMLKASAEKEQERIEEQTPSTDAGESGGEGARAKGPEGSMGTTATTQTGHRMALKGRSDNQDVHISREQAREEASRFGMIGLLQAVSGGEGPSAPWGRDTAEGRDSFSAAGNMWGADIGESFGAGGLGLHSFGEGGGGPGEGIGLGKVGTLFGGAGTCKEGENCRGFGNSHGTVPGGHTAKTPQVRPGGTTVSGRIAPELIQRIVRQSFGRFRLCYENGLRSNPNLQGRVAVRFVIDRTGAVSSVGNGGSDLPDSAVVSCVVRSFSGLSFPQPENGIVTVVYPISFAPGS